MPKLAPHVLPAYRLHRQSGQAVVTLNGKDILLGRHNTPASREAYNRVTGQWMAAGRQLSQESRPLMVVELLASFLEYAERYYRKPDGTPTAEADNFKYAMAPLRACYGLTSAADFGPLGLKAVREYMINVKGWGRRAINRQCSRIRQIFKWAASNELVPASVYHSLETVAGLQPGRSDAPETEPVKPVADIVVEATLPHVSTQIRTMMQIQRLTGMRPGEVCTMRGAEVDRTSMPWIYRPVEHKTLHHGHERIVPLGPKAVALLQPLLKPDEDAYIFDPRDAIAERHRKQKSKRKTPPNCGNHEGTNRKQKPKRVAGECYNVDAYRRATTRGCDAAFPSPAPLARLRVQGAKEKGRRWETPAEWKTRLGERWPELLAWLDDHRWHPHQLRHTAATALRREHGIEAAQVILGHRTLKVTELYAEANVEEAKRVMNLVG